MPSRKVIACLLSLASLYIVCAAVAIARQSTSGRAKASEPEVRWSEVQIEFEGNKLFTGEQLLKVTWQCVDGYR